MEGVTDMKKNRTRKIFITLVGALAGNISLFGFYPIGMAYLTAGYIERVYRYILFPVVLVSMAMTATPMQIAKYGLSMVVVMVMVGLVEKFQDKCPVWLGASFAGITIAIMQMMEYLLQDVQRSILIQGMAEAVLIVSLTVIVCRFIEAVLSDDGITVATDVVTAEPVVVTYNPGKDKMEESAKAFRNLANTFYSLPSKKEHLDKEDLEMMVQEVSDELCCACEKWETCWKTDYEETCRTAYDLWDATEEYGEVITEDMKTRLEKRCIRSSVFLEESRQIFKRARLNLVWNNRLIENREAVADQLNEMAGIISGVAQEVYDIPQTEEELETKLIRRLRLAHIIVKKVIVMERREKRSELHITMRANGNLCIATKELEGVISKVCGKQMVSTRDSRAIVNREYCTIIFVDDVNFTTLYGVARATKSQESISGDNFSFLPVNDGQLIMSLSDGMGSGINAYRESATVIDLLEQFLEAGFRKETAVRMINSSLVMRGDNPFFSTIDISAIDLYSGVCEFLKIGASTTFIKRNNWVESIASTSLPAGVFHQMELESVSKKLSDGDFIIMVTDGVLDNLPIENQEVLIQDIIMEAETTNPKQLASHILKSVLAYRQGEAVDDMTVLVTGIWKK